MCLRTLLTVADPAEWTVAEASAMLKTWFRIPAIDAIVCWIICNSVVPLFTEEIKKKKRRYALGKKCHVLYVLTVSVNKINCDQLKLCRRVTVIHTTKP